MKFRGAISVLVLLAMLTWTLGATCAPLPTMYGPTCVKMMYRTMVVEHPATHKCCPPEKMIVVVCYRMHGNGECDQMKRCLMLHSDEAVSGTAKYHDDGQARACATAHATKLLIAPSEHSGATWESAGPLHARPVLDLKSDLRV